MNRMLVILLLFGIVAAGGCAAGGGSQGNNAAADVADGLPEDVMADVRKVLASGRDKVILREEGMPEGDPGEIICREVEETGTRIQRISCMTRFELQRKRDEAQQAHRQILMQNAAKHMGN